MFRSERKRHKNARRASGAVITLFKDHMQRGLTKLPSKSKDCIWCKLDKDVFGLESDIFLCNTYLVPENSPHFRNEEGDVIESLDKDISQYITQGDIIHSH